MTFIDSEGRSVYGQRIDALGQGQSGVKLPLRRAIDRPLQQTLSLWKSLSFISRRLTQRWPTSSPIAPRLC